VTGYVPPERRSHEWARDAALMAAASHIRSEIAARLCVDQDTANWLLHTGLINLAVELLHGVLGTGPADDWLDDRVADFVDQDLLDPDDAVILVALAVCQGDALVLAAPGQRWATHPDAAALQALPPAVTITARDGGLIDLRHDNGREEHAVDVSLLTGRYYLAHWDRADHEVP
jgi:hypothetical protein